MALRAIASATAAGACGVLLGAANHDHPTLSAMLATLKRPAAKVDASSPTALSAAAVRLANEANGLCVLSTRSQGGGVSSRMVQPLPVASDAARGDELSVSFHTTRRSRKFAELSADAECTLTYINPSELTCVTLVGKAERLGAADEGALRDTWPLFPPLSMLYADGLDDFSGWRLRPTRVQVVSVPASLGGGPRPDWAPPEIERCDGNWRLVCKGGMQGG